MKYILNPNYTFCGWEGLPFAIRNNADKEVRFLTKARFERLWSCDGYTNLEPDDELKALIENNVISEAPEGSRLVLHSYTRYPCRYRGDVQLSITGKCNYRCRHCFQSAPHGVLGQPTTQEVLDELDQLAACGVLRVSLTGGEPLIHPGFWEIVDRIIANGMFLTTIYSNGALVNEKLVEGFESRGIKPGWSISFDGIGCHDEMRGVKGAEAQALAAIRLLTDHGFNVGCGYSLTRKSVKVFRESVKLLASLGVHGIKSGYTMPQGEWMNHPEEWMTDAEYLDFYRTYIPQYIEDGKPLSLQFEGLFESKGGKDEAYGFMTERDLSEKTISTAPTCASFAKSFYIGPTGRVLPCMSMDGTPAGERFDSLRDKPLSAILSKGSYFIDVTGTTMKDVFDHNCEECEHCDQRAHCGSGCRANAIGGSGDDFFALDKRTCLLCKEDWAGKVRKAIEEANT